MNIAVLQFPGTNCEYDTKYAFEKLGCKVTIVWHKDSSIPQDTDLVVIPGGFSYGDYLRSGAIARFANVMESVQTYAAKGGKVLGICNGFQILLEAGLLPGAMKRNNTLHFISKFKHLKVVNNDNIFLSKLKKDQVVNIPVAHFDGNYFIEEEGLKELEENNQILLRYCDENGNVESLNGSVSHIAGICNKEKNVFGLMPHPERAMEDILGCSDGEAMLRGFLK
ncbi:phosphoribosylformylglycinamidine synthase I [Halarcobacter ebronensis]|uniref:Phosphoribosylformylglycinamidine synthase subunit PurQ n=1 Tax=Halarcobacter ebronensis TaxID=1462615 RepID=A0A4Q1AUD5_9BACT|nr:phosphoribosylformylglycinamidine synthase I [Halarcobacter ebronensis]QKF80866.1 phosphoribosylformylglycinamidine synthase PurLQS, glutaminase subunit PurQ [Halarcobacter ebronensis]RXJ67921.1 phosphoribosylformylglycinamidine synthase I [Halarcobacter ebronensis]RXK08656.1 phosphoribosylformylglycinamidine synthase I [Halarcobacter ebronensis]